MKLIRNNVERVVEDDAVAKKLQAEGYKLLDDLKEPDTLQDSEMSINTLESMTVEELKAFAKEKGIKGCSGLPKSDLLEILKGVI
jgi:hypothetical protein